MGTPNRGNRPLGLVEQLAQAALALEADGRVSLANLAASELLGRPRAELIGRPAQDLLAERIRRQAEASSAFELEQGRAAVRDDGELSATRGDAEFPVEVRVSPDGADGRIVTLRDISERVEAQHALRFGSERLSQDAPDALVGSWEWDILANDVQWSDRLFRIYGLEPGSVVPTYERFLAYVHPDDRDAVDERNRKAFADHQPFKDVKRVIRADGTEILMRTQGEVITDASGQPVRMIGVCEDVTAYEQAHDLLGGLRE
ncbi:MAG: PAS domain S-box protein [Solirubrobacteraceae bacterium]|nr:PAS domain S-box protein [Solirubrobacteraceae bacterium]